MITYLNGSTQGFLNTLRSINTRMTKAETEVASGLRITQASDDPQSVVRLLETRADLDQLDQVTSNLSRIKTEVDTSEDALSSAVDLYDNVRTLAMKGASTTVSADTRKSLAQEVESIMQQMVGLANSQVNGRYLFSGDSDQTAAYTWDSAATPPWGAYLGASSSRQAIGPTGVSFPVAMDAQQIFDSSATDSSVFQSMENLRQALLADDDTAIETALGTMATVSAYLNSAQAFYGNVQDEIAKASSAADTLSVQLNTELSNVQDADMTEAIVELQQLKYTQTAALQVRSAMPKTSLFDYMG